MSTASAHREVSLSVARLFCQQRTVTAEAAADARRRHFDAIPVWKIDRFGRSLKHLVVSLADLAAPGVAFISLRDNLDLSTPSGRLMIQIIGAMAEFEQAQSGALSAIVT